MNQTLQTIGTSCDPSRCESGCRIVVAVFGYEKMNTPTPAPVRVVAGDHQLLVDGAYQASLVGRVHALLETRGLEILRMEQSSRPDCFALLIHARTTACSTANMVALRRDLQAQGQELGVTIRVQREELFLYMHRI